MAHPSLQDIVAGTAAAHVERCPSCRQLAVLAGIEVAPPTDDLDRLAAVDPALYTEWTPLPEARGGMGTLFRARDRRLGRHVAIKQLRTDLPEAEREQLAGRFEREARLTARLQHPAIVGVHEAGTLGGGEPFYAMPLLRGRPLGAELARRPTLAERLALLPHLTTVAEAIAYAHEQGIVHRDLKPDNILIGEFGETTVLDWGLAKDVNDGSTTDDGAYRTAPTDGLTQLGVGTANYMPPEQARGDTPEPSFDVYALGATLYHLLAGVPPYDGTDSSTIRRALIDRTPPRPLIDLVPDVPPELADMVASAMALDGGARLPSARELARELRRFQTGQLLASRRYTLRELVAHYARRHRTTLQIVAVAVVALVAFALIAFVRISRARDRATESQHRAERALRRAQGLVASGRARDPGTRFDAVLDGIRALAPDLAGGDAPVPEALQGLTDAVIAGPPLVSLPRDGVIKWFATAGDRLIGIDDARAVQIWDARSGRRITSYPSSLPQPERPIVAPDGAHIVVCGFDPIGEVIDLATGAAQQFSAKTNFAGCGFLPDGRLIAAADDVTVRDARTLAVLARFPLPAPANAFALGRTGHAAVSTLDGTLWAWDGDHAPAVQATRLPLGDALAFDRDERVLVQGGADQIVRGFAATDLSAAPRELFADRNSDEAWLLASPELDRIAVGLWDADGDRRSHVLDLAAGTGVDVAGNVVTWAQHAWFVTDALGPLALVDSSTGGTVLPMRAHGAEATALAYGDRLASASRDGAAYLWDLSGTSGMMLGHTGEVTAIVARGDALATASLDGSVRVWGTDGSARTAIPGAHEVTHLAWLDDHTLVAGDLGGHVRVLDITGTIVADADLGAPLSAIAVSPTGALALGTLDGALVLSPRTLDARRTLATADAGAVTALAFTLDGTRVVSSHADGSTRLWDATSGSALATRADLTPVDDPTDHEGAIGLVPAANALFVARPAGTTQVLTLDLAPRSTLDGRLIATSDAVTARALPEGTLIVRDAAGEHRLTGHRAAILAAVFTTDHRLASASADGTVRVWNLATGRADLVITAADVGLPTQLAAVGDAIVVGYASGALRHVPITPRALLARACAIVARFARTDEVAPYCPAVDSITTSRR